MPSWMRYYSTISLVAFYEAMIRIFLSEELQLQLAQNPCRRAIVLSTVSSYEDRMAFDPLHIGAEVWAVAMWSNLLYFCAQATIGQLILYNAHRQRMSRRNRYSIEFGGRGNDRDTEEGHKILVTASWKFQYSTTRRYLFSALGAGLGSMIWPGWGTLVGIGLGDTYGQVLPVPQIPQLSIRTPLAWCSRVWNLVENGTPVPPRNDEGSNAEPSPNREKRRNKIEYNEARLCGCCQIAAFSANPNHRDRAPVSSRVCDHSICRSCVTKCHLMHMERNNTFEEWIKCPLCNAACAFSSHDHLINRSLCEILAWIDDKSND